MLISSSLCLSLSLCIGLLEIENNAFIKLNRRCEKELSENKGAFLGENDKEWMVHFPTTGALVCTQVLPNYLGISEICKKRKYGEVKVMFLRNEKNADYV